VARPVCKRHGKDSSVNRLFGIGGVVASIILIAVGIGAIAIGASGRSEVRDTVRQENIVGSPDMTPEATRSALQEAGLSDVSVPDCSVAEQEVETGSEAKCFAEYMRIHALEATEGKTYAEMPRFVDEEGNPVEDEEQAATDRESGQPVENELRNLWVTETALATALQTSYFAEQVALFSIVVGIALVLTGIGFLVLTLGLLRQPRAAG
jgi:hypothetical protein